MPRLIVVEHETSLEHCKWEDQPSESQEPSKVEEALRFDWTFDRNIEDTIAPLDDGHFSYIWTPDIPLDGSITKAWYMCLVRYGTDEESPGAVGLTIIPSPTDESKWARIGLLGWHGFPSSERGNGTRMTVQNQYNEVD
jgi:hypothetical protein